MKIIVKENSCTYFLRETSLLQNYHHHTSLFSPYDFCNFCLWLDFYFSILFQFCHLVCSVHSCFLYRLPDEKMTLNMLKKTMKNSWTYAAGLQSSVAITLFSFLDFSLTFFCFLNGETGSTMVLIVMVSAEYPQNPRKCSNEIGR